jgi:glucose-6-phosphate 1-epimerase
VGNIDSAHLTGLQSFRYRDSADGGTEREEHSDFISIAGEMDRIYFDTPAHLRLREPDRELAIWQDGFKDTVVWNPGPAKAAALADMEQPHGYRRMLCVEAATIGQPVVLASGQRWTGSQALHALLS